MTYEAQTFRNGSAPTMNDVAELAGVSIKSVSRVINNELHVSQKLRTKVEAAIEQLGYVPDQAARSLAGARSFTISVLFDNPSPHYTMMVQAGIYRACVDAQYHLRIDNLDTKLPWPELEARLTALLRNGRVDGLILTPPLTDNVRILEFLERSGVAYSRIAPFTDLQRSPGTRTDDETAGALVAELLWKHGHRRFGIITGPRKHGAANARRTGFMNRIHALDPSIEIAEAYGAFEFVRGIEAGRELLNAASRPTAIFATNDDSAAGAMVAIREAGLSVPEDISVCGFDNSWVATSVWPMLTTINQPIEQMAFVAANMLIGQRAKQDSDKVETLAFELVERASVGAAP